MKIKRYIKIELILFIIIFTLSASCTKKSTTTPEENCDKDVAIEFITPIINKITKADEGYIGAIDNSIYPTTESFGVFSIMHDSPLEASSNWNDLTKVWYNNIKATYNPNYNNPLNSAGGWQAGYWPNSTSYLSFIAYSPYRASNNCTSITADKNGLTITDFINTPNTEEGNFDLLYSDWVMNKRMQDAINSTNGTYNGIQLLFKHALSNIEFNVARADDYVGAQIYVNRIRLINVAKKATFEQNAESSTPVWRDHDFKDHTILCFGNTNGTTDFSVDSKEPTPLLEDNEGHPVLAIPQSLIVTSRAADLQPQLEITFSIISPGSTIKIRNKKTIDLSSLNVLRWEMGKKYIYNIKISLTTIKVNIGVDNWDEVL